VLAQHRIILRLRLDLFDAIMSQVTIFSLRSLDLHFVYDGSPLVVSLLGQEIAFFDESRTGELISRLASDTGAVAGDLSWLFRWSIESVVRVLGVSAYFFTVSRRLALVAWSIIPVVTIINRQYGSFLHKNSQRVQVK